MSGINSVGGMGGMGGMAMMYGMRRPDPAKMAENLFDKLDTSGQGYLQKSDFQTAFDSIAPVSGSSSSTSTNVDDLFAKLDTNSDGKVTKDEFSTSLSKLAEQLDQQFQSMRMQDAMGGMGGMPPPGNDAGFTKDELSSQLDQLGGSDSSRSSLLSGIVQNFDKADANGDGKVSAQEAMAYSRSSQSSSTATDASATTLAAAGDTEGKLMLQIMRLMQAYHIGGASASQASTLSVTA